MTRSCRPGKLVKPLHGYALVITPFTHFHCGDYATASAQLAKRFNGGPERRRVLEGVGNDTARVRSLL